MSGLRVGEAGSYNRVKAGSGLKKLTRSMGVLEQIDEQMAEFLENSPVYFVATAPSGQEGHINLSPKGLNSFRVLGPTSVAYLDLTGSGAETIAHLRQNGRITFLFAAFSDKPRIVRLYGRGSAVFPDATDFEELVSKFETFPGIRSVIRVTVDRIAPSCGFGVPLMDYVGMRSELVEWAERKGRDGIAAYQRDRNRKSIDGLSAMDFKD